MGESEVVKISSYSVCNSNVNLAQLSTWQMPAEPLQIDSTEAGLHNRTLQFDKCIAEHWTPDVTSANADVIQRSQQVAGSAPAIT